MSLTPYRPATYTAEDAAHLLRRLAFGGTDDQIRALQAQGPQRAAESLLTFNQSEAPDNPFTPDDAVDIGSMLKVTQARWLHEMVHGAAPAREKLALFWHNHFVIGTDKVKNSRSLAGYLALLRGRSLGNFTDFALDIARSPAMLDYLDNDQNKRGKPNENFARELMELFTMGIGHYTEQDVHEGARALTGWTYVGGRKREDFQEEPQFAFQQKQHDDGVKTYLGRSGTFMPEDIVKMAAGHPATGDFIARKLWRGFVNDTPDEAGVKALADLFRDTRGDLGQVMHALVTSQVFYAPENRARIIKSPAEYVVGALRALGGPQLEEKAYLNLTGTLARMGQQLLQPPTVKGWDGGREWINDSTLLLRMQTAAALTLGRTKGKQATQAAPRIGGRVLLPSSLALLGSERSLLGPALAGLNPAQQAYLMLISPEYALA